MIRAKAVQAAPIAALMRLRRSSRRRRLRELGDSAIRQSADRPIANRQITRSPDRQITNIDLAMMQRALELARQAAAMGEVPIGAVLYRGQQVIAEEFNQREASGDPTGHAELLAIIQAGRALGRWRLTDCSLAVTLEPCPMCAGAMVNARLGRLIYGTADPKAGACETLYQIPIDQRLNHRVTMFGGVLAHRCRQLLQDFFQQRRRVNSECRSAKNGLSPQ